MKNTIEWHDGKPYGICQDCRKPVRVNKPLFGSLHVCLTECEKAERHFDVETVTVGPFWKRKNVRQCRSCGTFEGK